MEIKIFTASSNISQEISDNKAATNFIQWFKLNNKKAEDIIAFVPTNVSDIISYKTKLWILIK